jgi:hypothetical protein
VTGARGSDAPVRSRHRHPGPYQVLRTEYLCSHPSLHTAPCSSTSAHSCVSWIDYYLSVYQFIYQFIYQPICVSVYLSSLPVYRSPSPQAWRSRVAHVHSFLPVSAESHASQKQELGAMCRCWVAIQCWIAIRCWMAIRCLRCLWWLCQVRRG